MKNKLKEYVIKNQNPIKILDTKIMFSKTFGQPDTLVTETRVSPGVRRILAEEGELRIEIEFKHEFFVARWKFKGQKHEFERERMNNICWLFGYSQLHMTSENTWISVVPYRKLKSPEDFYKVFSSMYNIADIYAFELGEEERKQRHESLKQKEEKLNIGIDMKLVRLLEKEILEEMKLRIKELLETSSEHKGNQKEFLIKEYFLSNRLLSEFEEQSDSEQKKRLIRVLHAPWHDGNWELHEELISNDHGMLHADVMLAAMYYSITGSRATDLEKIRAVSEIREIEEIILNYVVDSIETNAALDEDDIDSAVEELSVVLLRR